MFNGIRARVGAGRPASARRRDFFLDSDPLPKVLPSQGLGDGDDEVQELVADGPGDPGNDDAEREALFYRSDCHHCGAMIYWRNLPEHPRGGYWSHGADRVDHNAEPLRIGGYTEQPPMRIEDAMAKFEEAVISGALRGPTPIADDLRADRERLLDANGTLARRVRLLEAQLRAAGIEPAARE